MEALVPEAMLVDASQSFERLRSDPRHYLRGGRSRQWRSVLMQWKI
jgi:hypothetical protein